MTRRIASWTVISTALALTPAPAVASHGTTTRVSVSSPGIEGNDDSFLSDISADGRFVAFASESPNLVPGDTNLRSDVFVHDRVTGETERVSVADDGEEADDRSVSPSISADGRYVAFQSFAGNLVDPEKPLFSHHWGTFVRDRLTRRTIGVSMTKDGKQGFAKGPAISPDGLWVAYYSNDERIVSGKPPASGFDVYLYSLESATTTRIVCGGNTPIAVPGWRPDVSADGRTTVFECDKRLVPEATHRHQDVYLYDRLSGATTVAVPWASKQRLGGLSTVPSVSADGSLVAFQSTFDDLVEGDTNNSPDIFVFDVERRNVERVSVSTAGEEAAYSAVAGPYLLFPYSVRPSISSDGRYVAFTAPAANLVPLDTNMATDAFVRDRLMGLTRRVSVSTYGAQADGDALGALWRVNPTAPLTLLNAGLVSDYPSVASTGAVSFESYSTNLVHSDTNGALDIFVQDPSPRPYDCRSGYAEGPASGPLHGVVAPHSGPAGVVPRTVGCVAATAGL